MSAAEVDWRIVDYADAVSLAAACDGVDAVIHCANSFRRDIDSAMIEAARRARVPGFVYISIVGVDRVPFDYYRRKLAAEEHLERSGLPFTILRATQFHDVVCFLLDRLARPPVMLVPAGSLQPIDAGEVAAHLVELALSAPAGRAPDAGGPQVRRLRELASAYLRALGRRRRIVSVRLPGALFKALRSGALLCPDHAAGRITFDAFLARRAAEKAN